MQRRPARMPRRATLHSRVVVLLLFMAFHAGGMTARYAHAEDGVVIESVSVDGVEIVLPTDSGTQRTPIRIPANAREVVFRFREPAQQPSENRPPSKRLRYRLDGHDEGWQDISAAARALPQHGHSYRLCVCFPHVAA